YEVEELSVGNFALMRDEIAEVVGENSEQSQAGNPVSGEDPEIASFTGMRLRGVGWRDRDTFRGPRLHETLLLRIVANVATLSPHLPSRQASLEADFTTVFGGNLSNFRVGLVRKT